MERMFPICPSEPSPRIKLQLLKDLDWKTLACLRLVSKAWRKWIDDHFFSPSIFRPQQSIPDCTLAFFKFDRVEKINLDNKFLSQRGLHILAEKLPATKSLTSLKLHNSTITDETFSIFCEALPKTLTEIHLSSCSHLTDKSFEQLVKKVSHHITRLTISNCQFTAQGLLALKGKRAEQECGFPLIAMVKLHNIEMRESLDKVLSNRKRIKLSRLDISNNPQLGDKEALKLLEAFSSNLKELNLTGCHLLTSKTIDSLTTLKDLEILGIGIKNLENNSFQRLVKRFSSSLRVLILEGCEKLHGEALNLLLSQKLKLEFLILKQCTALTEIDLKKYPNILISLKFLDLRETMIETLAFPRLSPQMLEGIQLPNRVSQLTLTSPTDQTAKKFIPRLAYCKKLYINDGQRLSSAALYEIFKALPEDIQELSFANTVLDDKEAALLDSKLKQCTKLDLSKCKNLTVKGLNAICEALGPNVQELYLNESLLNDEGVALLDSKLKQCTKLDLNKCKNLTVKGLNAICAALGSNVQELYLNESLLNDEGVALSNSKLKQCRKLDLSKCKNLTVKGLNAICEALGSNVQELYLNESLLNDEGAALLAPKLLQCNRLDLSECKNLSLEGWRTILVNLSPNMKKFKLTGSNLSNKEATLLAPKLLQCTHLDLSECKNLSLEGWRTILAGLGPNIKKLNLIGSSLEAITHLDLSECKNLTANGWKAISIALNPNIQKFCLRLSSLDDEGAALLASKLKQCVKLDLSFCNKLSAKGLNAICGALGPNIQKLNLTSSSLDDKGAALLASKLKQCVKLDLSSCDKLSAKGLNAICGALGPNIQKLNLTFSSLDDEGAALLASKLKQCVKLDLSFCNKLSAKGLNAICGALGPNIQKLNLTSSSLDDEGAALLASKLKQCVKLDLSFCKNLTANGWKIIFSALGPNIQELNLFGTSLDDKAVASLAPNSLHCKKLHFSGGSNLTAEGWSTIYMAIQPNIQELHLSGAFLGDREASLLASKLGQCVYLRLNECKNLHFTNNGWAAWKAIFTALGPNFQKLDLVNCLLHDAAAEFLVPKLSQCTHLNLNECLFLTAKSWEKILTGLSSKLQSLFAKGSPFKDKTEILTLAPHLKNCAVWIN